MVSASARFTFGQFECLVINDGTLIVPDSIPQGSSGRTEAPQGQKMDISCLFVNTGKQKILVDTGCGSGFMATTGNLVRNLQAEGISCAEIDTIIHTHGHLDHVGGSFDASGRPVFVNAHYIVLKKEWECWVTRPEKSQLEGLFVAARRYYLPIPERFSLVEDGAEVMPGIKLILAPGHTPGNAMLEISSGVKKLLCLGDMIHAPLEFTDPARYSFLDITPDQAIRTRIQVLSEAAKSGMSVFACHFPFPGLGHVVQKGAVLSWRPSQIDA